MTNANECTCPSGDGSLAHPCPAHPASVKQTGGDERDLQAEGAQGELLPCPFCGGQAHLTYDDYVHDDLRPMPVVECNACHTWVRAESWNKRAALAQPSLAHELDPLNLAPHAEAFNEAPAEVLKPEQAERPEVVAYRTIGRHEKHQHPHYALNYYKQNAEDQAAHWRERGCEVSEDELMTVAQHERIVGALRAENAKLSEALDRWPLIRDSLKLRLADALARVAELERQEPVALANRGLHAFWVKWTEAAAGLYGPGIKLYAAPVAQAQQLNDLDKQCRDDVARALGLRPNQERGFAWSYLLASIKSCVKASEDSAKAQHSVPEGWKLVPIEPLLNMMSDKDHDTRITAERQLLSILADAPGNLVPQAWLDVQAERRRQITAEGWTPEHDDEHSHGQMARAAACYALAGSSAPNDGTAALLVSLAWPWDEQWWKPSTARRDLVKACALALAEIERLDRAAHGKEGV
ncbi:hypothetical protein [Pseudomonas aeruginosa]|uniref:hypothetical protein n=1 Tax=Pseudomonas aeruginosa TaxID=287 RepID=UPI000B48BEB9|nr:hypothetical protein [Pseudomonas aeruginosa]OWI97677.1 hypothetical protein CDC19_11290 [Pseudomonas aeruginosa]